MVVSPHVSVTGYWWARLRAAGETKEGSDLKLTAQQVSMRACRQPRAISMNGQLTGKANAFNI
jgi:hypothetical protein